MPRAQNFNLDGKIGLRKCKVRKRGCSSSSSSSLVQNCRLKRCVLVGRKSVPMWKKLSSRSPSMEDSTAFSPKKSVERGKGSSISARKLAATLWEMNALPSPEVKSEVGVVRASEFQSFRKEETPGNSNLGAIVLGSSDLLHTSASQGLTSMKHRRRASAGSLKLLQSDHDLDGIKCAENCLVQVDQSGSSHSRRLKDVYNGLVTLKELLSVTSRLCETDQGNPAVLSLFSAVRFELNRSCVSVRTLLHEEKKTWSEIELLLEEEKAQWRLKEQERVLAAVAAVNSEMETEKKLRKQTERLNTQLGYELTEIKKSLSTATKQLAKEKRALGILEQVCDELARGIGEDRAELEKLKKQSKTVWEEVKKEREMLQLADVLREERVQMKLSEAKYQFEEKNAAVDELRSELESYLRSKKDEEPCDHSPSYDKIMELEKYLRETLPGPHKSEETNEEDDSDLHSIELNVEDENRGFRWINAAAGDEDSGKGKTEERCIEWEFTKQVENGKKDTEEMERYMMIKDLRDRIVSGARTQDHLPSSSKHIERAK